MSRALTFETKAAVFSAIDRLLGTQVGKVDFFERGATIRPRKNHIATWWVEGATFHGELYRPDTQHVGKFTVPVWK